MVLTDMVVQSGPTVDDEDSGPLVLVMDYADDGSQVGSCSGEPPRGDQYLGRCEDAYHDSVDMHGAR
jgi:hypothetical protein